jgi:hypothetical protein
VDCGSLLPLCGGSSLLRAVRSFRGLVITARGRPTPAAGCPASQRQQAAAFHGGCAATVQAVSGQVRSSGPLRSAFPTSRHAHGRSSRAYAQREESFLTEWFHCGFVLSFSFASASLVLPPTSPKPNCSSWRSILDRSQIEIAPLSRETARRGSVGCQASHQTVPS